MKFTHPNTLSPTLHSQSRTRVFRAAALASALAFSALACSNSQQVPVAGSGGSNPPPPQEEIAQLSEISAPLKSTYNCALEALAPTAAAQSEDPRDDDPIQFPGTALPSISCPTPGALGRHNALIRNLRALEYVADNARNTALTNPKLATHAHLLRLRVVEEITRQEVAREQNHPNLNRLFRSIVDAYEQESIVETAPHLIAEAAGIKSLGLREELNRLLEATETRLQALQRNPDAHDMQTPMDLERLRRQLIEEIERIDATLEISSR